MKPPNNQSQTEQKNLFKANKNTKQNSINNPKIPWNLRKWCPKFRWGQVTEGVVKIGLASDGHPGFETRP